MSFGPLILPGLLMRVTGQIQEVTLVPCVSGLWCVVCSDVFKCFTKIRGVTFKRGKKPIPVGQQDTSLCERALLGRYVFRGKLSDCVARWAGVETFQNTPSY